MLLLLRMPVRELIVNFDQRLGIKDVIEWKFEMRDYVTRHQEQILAFESKI